MTNRFKKNISILAISILSAYPIIEKLLLTELQIPLLATLAFMAAFLLVIFNYANIIRTKPFEIWFCALFAVIAVVSESFMKTNSFSFLYGKLFTDELIEAIFGKEADMAGFLKGNIGYVVTVVAGVIRTVGWFFISVLVISYLKLLILKSERIGSELRITKWLCGKYSFVKIFSIIVALWLPFLIIKFPGSCSSDASNQISEFFGEIQLSNRNPVFSTLFFGSLVWLGTIIVNFTFGIFLCTFVQLICMALIFTCCIEEILKFQIDKKYITYLTFFYSLAPFFGNSASSIVKDSLYCSLFALFIIKTIVFIKDWNNKNYILKDAFFVAISGVLMSLFRHNGFFSLIPIAVFLILIILKSEAKNKIKAICILLSSVAVVSGLNITQKYAMGVNQGSTAEILSIPFQQTARYIATYPDEVTEDEKKAINAVLDYDNIGKNYNPYVSDPVKSTYKGDDSALKPYFKVWFSQMLKHPLCYAESLINLTYPAFCLDKSNLRSYTPYTVDSEAYKQLDFFGKFRLLLLGYSVAYSFVPGVSQLVNPVSYVWIFIYLLFYSISKKDKKGLVILVPFVVTIIGVIGGPAVINHPRYLYPIVWSIPLVIPYFVEKMKSSPLQKIDN